MGESFNYKWKKCFGKVYVEGEVCGWAKVGVGNLVSCEGGCIEGFGLFGQFPL